MKNLMQFVPKGATRAVAQSALLARGKSPTFLFGAGVVGVVGTVVLASAATLKMHDKIDQTQKEIQLTKELKEVTHPTEAEYKRRLAKVYFRHGVSIARLYAPAFGLGVISITCLAGSHRILTQRNVALTAAYAAVDQGFKEYRGRVIAELGEDKDREFRHGYEDREILVDDKKGGHTIETVRSVKPGTPSMYARFFDEFSPRWEPNAESNLLFIKCQQNWANDRLQAKGFLFLNDVYEALGLDKTYAGQVVGWTLGPDRDNFVTFGVFDDPNNERAIAFVNGREKSILLDFNVSGVILDEIERHRS